MPGFKLVTFLALLHILTLCGHGEAFSRELSQADWRLNRKLLESRSSSRIMQQGEEGDGGAVEDDGDGDSDDSSSPSSSSSHKSSSMLNVRTNGKSKNKDEDDIMSDLLKPKKDDGKNTTTMKPFMIVNNQKNKNQNQHKHHQHHTDGDGQESDEDFKSAIDKAMEKASSIAETVGDAIKAAINNVAAQLKSATDSGSNSSCTKSNCTHVHEMSNPYSSGPGHHNHQGHMDTIHTTGRSYGPVSLPTGRHRRSRMGQSEVAKWPPALPLAGRPPMVVEEGSVESIGGLKDSEGGVISKGKVVDGDVEEPQNLPLQMTTMSNSGESTEGGQGSGESTEKAQSPSHQRNNMTRNIRPGRPNKKMMPTMQRDVTLTVSGAGSGTIGTSSTGVSSSISSSSSNDINTGGSYGGRKPGQCRPLTRGLTCIALAPEASQCSSDNGCPGTQKCCFYGCAPYTGIGMCEYPVVPVL